MICCAVGICAITERKREKNSVQMSNSKLLNRAMTFSAIIFGVLETQRARRAKIDHFDDLRGVEPAQLIVALAADAEELDLLALGHQRIRALAREPHDRGVERAAQAALGGADQKQMHVVAAGAAQQPRRGVEAADRRGDIAEHLVHAGSIGTRRLGRRLRAAQLRGRDHLHGLGDLLRRLGGGDAVAQVFETGHRTISIPSS